MVAMFVGHSVFYEVEFGVDSGADVSLSHSIVRF